MMPKIQRSVEYTFEAYSGADDDGKEKSDKSNDKLDDDISDLDENSMKLFHYFLMFRWST